jgi:hypothetical protein
VEAHILAQAGAGPRGSGDLTEAELDAYENLVLLCANHHKVVDDDVATYTAEVLREWKREREQTVLESESPEDSQWRHDEGTCAAYVEEWVRRSRLDEWQGWTSWLLSNGQPSLYKDEADRLRSLRDWLFNRVWPKRFESLETAFDNFRVVLNDLLEVFFRHAEEHGDSWLTRKIYHDVQGSHDYEERSQQLLKVYEDHVDLVEDLVLELTRAANYVCDNVRISLDPSFRLTEGAATCTYGPTMDLKFITIRPEYSHEERESVLYPGLGPFDGLRNNRDHHFGPRHGDE